MSLVDTSKTAIQRKSASVVMVVALTTVFIFYNVAGFAEHHRPKALLAPLSLFVDRWPSGRLNDTQSNRRIFFHETSGRDALTMRWTCAVESAALHNPDRPVELYLMADRVDHSSRWLRALANYSNVRVILLGDGFDYFVGSPFEPWYRNGEWKTSRFQYAHMADYIRLLSLLKGGGMFLDLDVITLKSYDDDMFTNFFVVMSARIEGVANGMIHLNKHHWLIDAMVAKLLSVGYDPDNYVGQGPGITGPVLTERCGFQPGRSNHHCPDIHLLSHHFFFPIGDPFWGQYFAYNDSQHIMDDIQRCGSYGVHISNSLTANATVDLTSPVQVFSRLASKNCPLTVAEALSTA